MAKTYPEHDLYSKIIERANTWLEFKHIELSITHKLKIPYLDIVDYNRSGHNTIASISFGVIENMEIETIYSMITSLVLAYETGIAVGHRSGMSSVRTTIREALGFDE